MALDNKTSPDFAKKRKVMEYNLKHLNAIYLIKKEIYDSMDLDSKGLNIPELE